MQYPYNWTMLKT